MKHSKGKKHAQRQISKRKNKARSHIKKKPTKRIQSSNYRILKKHQSKKSTRRPIHSRRNSASRARGYSQTKVFTGSRTGKEIGINRKVSTFAKKDYVKIDSRNKLIGKKSNRYFSKINEQYKKIGKSKGDNYIISFQYKVKVNGKWRTQYFSGASADIRNENELYMYYEMIQEQMNDVLSDYLGRGMQGIILTGVKTQGYYEPKARKTRGKKRKRK